MRKSVWLVLPLLLAACSLPFSFFNPMADEEPAVALQETVARVVVEETAVCQTCPACESETAECAGLVPVVTEMAATLEAFYEADAAAAMPEPTAAVLAQGAMPELADLEDAQQAMPELTEVVLPSDAMPTLTPTPDAALAAMPDVLPEAPVVNAQYLPNAPIYKQNFARPGQGCNWQGVAGQVLDRAGNPVLNLVVVAEGVSGGQELLRMDLTGLHGAYGPGGYELELGEQPLASSNMIYLTVFDLDGNTLSSAVPIVTHADCNRNLLLLNFQQSP